MDHALIIVILMIGVCHLCQSEEEIKLSHIIPRFAYEWLFNTSPGFLRNATNPNLRIQDGIKSELLCENCEQRLSKWEKTFAENIFKPLHESHEGASIFPYDDWALKFAVSVSWRILLLHIKKSGLSHFSEMQRAHADRALTTWGEFMLNHRDDPGPYEQHMLFFDVIEHHTFTDLSPYMNRYLLRTVDMDVISSGKSALVYSKIGRIAIFGVIQSDMNDWNGTRINLKTGFSGNNCRIPLSIYHYINARSNKVAQSIAGISPKQHSKINSMLKKELKERPTDLANSEPFTAMVHDVKLSGKEAFKATQPSNSDDK